MVGMRISTGWVMGVVVAAAAVCGAGTQVNTHTKNAQQYPDVAVAPDGRSVVAWWSSSFDGQGGGIFARLYGADGQPLGDEFRVNVTSPILGRGPAVAMDAAGNFVAVWATSSDTDDKEEIVLRRFDPNGVPLTDEIQVNTYTLSRQIHPKIAMNAQGQFVIVWETWLGHLDHANQWYIGGRLYHADATPRSGEFTINETPNGSECDVAMNSSGAFTVTWGQSIDFGTAYTDELQFRQYDASGNALGDPVAVVGAMDSSCGPSIAMDPNGGFFIAGSYHPLYVELRDVYAECFDAAGQPTSEQFMVNEYTDGAQTSAAIALKGDGGFVVCWYGEGKRQSAGIYARSFDALGAPTSDAITIAYCSDDDYGQPAFGIDAAGRMTVVWRSMDLDGSNYGVFRRTVDVP